jgi:hypothetical protein
VSVRAHPSRVALVTLPTAPALGYHFSNALTEILVTSLIPIVLIALVGVSYVHRRFTILTKYKSEEQRGKLRRASLRQMNLQRPNHNPIARSRRTLALAQPGPLFDIAAADVGPEHDVEAQQHLTEDDVNVDALVQQKVHKAYSTHMYYFLLITYLFLPSISRLQFKAYDCIKFKDKDLYLRMDTGVCCVSSSPSCLLTRWPLPRVMRLRHQVPGRGLRQVQCHQRHHDCHLPDRAAPLRVSAVRRSGKAQSG